MFFSIRKNAKYSIIILVSLFLVVLVVYPLINQETTEDELTDLTAKQVNNPLERNLELITKYVVGEDTVIAKTEVVDSVEEVEKRYPDYRILEVSNNKIVLERSIEDLSPKLKNGNPYFGLGEDGHLTLYQGNPEENQIIQTFFRIDIEKLESGLPKEPVEQLYRGIQIRDLAEYNSVLSTFSEYSLN